MFHLPTADPYLSGHGDPSYSVRHYDLDLAYVLDGNRLRGTATLDVVVLEETSRIVLDLAHLRATKVRLEGAGLKKWSARSDRLILQLAERVALNLVQRMSAIATRTAGRNKTSGGSRRGVQTPAVRRFT